jgi:hypothetical protein
MPIPDNEDEDEEDDDDYEDGADDQDMGGANDALKGSTNEDDGREDDEDEHGDGHAVTKMMSACGIMYNLYEYLHADEPTRQFNKNVMDMVLTGNCGVKSTCTLDY